LLSGNADDRPRANRGDDPDGMNRASVAPTRNTQENHMSSRVSCIAAVAVWVLGACGGGSDHNPNATPTPTTSTITVSGRVVNNWKNPIAAMPVVVSGKPPLVTDGNGRFSVSDVTPPYDVSVVHIGSKTATIYKGLTRTDPVLVGTSDAVTAQTANLSGSISSQLFRVLHASISLGHHSKRAECAEKLSELGRSASGKANAEGRPIAL